MRGKSFFVTFYPFPEAPLHGSSRNLSQYMKSIVKYTWLRKKCQIRALKKFARLRARRKNGIHAIFAFAVCAEHKLHTWLPNSTEGGTDAAGYTTRGVWQSQTPEAKVAWMPPRRAAGKPAWCFCECKNTRSPNSTDAVWAPYSVTIIGTRTITTPAAPGMPTPVLPL